MKVLAIAVLALPALAQPAPDFTSLEQTAREELAKSKIPGASIAVIRGSRVIFAKGFGAANVETGEPVRPEMEFRLGSTTKMLTASALVGLSLEGKLDLNAPIGKYLRGLPPGIAAVTANQLLSHTAGIHDEAPMYGSHDDEALARGIAAWTDQWLFTRPGRIFSYSNPGYWMAGYLIEVLSGKPYADAMSERVFKPAGMKQTTLRPTLAMTYPLAQGHDERSGKLEIARPAADNAAGWPAGSVFSCTADLARFVIALLNDGAVDGARVLDPRIFALLSAPHAQYPDSSEQYGYGLSMHEVRGVRIVEHGGSRMGYGSSIRMAPEQRVAVIALTNRTGAGMPATTEKALELMLPMSPKAAQARRVQETSADDLRRHAGLYRNGDARVEIVARGNQLFIKRGRDENALEKLGPARFGIEGATGTYVFVPGANGVSEFVHSGSRSFARVP